MSCGNKKGVPCEAAVARTVIRKTENPKLVIQGVAFTFTLVSVVGTQVGKLLELSVRNGANKGFIIITYVTIRGWTAMAGHRRPHRMKALLRDLPWLPTALWVWVSHQLGAHLRASTEPLPMDPTRLLLVSGMVSRCRGRPGRPTRLQ